jgi:hypothetical protein
MADNTWLIDMMVGIMHNPTWNEPLSAFINEKCVLFDNFEEENRHEYMIAQRDFKCLVDNLLAAHLLEVDISPEEFEKQCIESGLVEDPRLQQVVNQLMAAEDFMTFKNMMVERHMSLQQQAESNYTMLTTDATAGDAALAASMAAEMGQGIPSSAPSAQPTYQAVAPVPSPMPVSTPSVEAERKFGAGGGFYGRAAMPSGNSGPPSKEKADAIRKALSGALRPK